MEKEQYKQKGSERQIRGKIKKKIKKKESTEYIKNVKKCV